MILRDVKRAWILFLRRLGQTWKFYKGKPLFIMADVLIVISLVWWWI